jgi:hypothetical protein
MLQARSLDNVAAHADQDKCDPSRVLFKHDRLYQHNLLRTNYTSYDVRRGQDVMNPLTSHHNIMVLADPEDNNESTSDHPFRYARILGVYHANVVYVGHGMIDYQPHRFEFLWVRWYKNSGVVRNGWLDQKLDRIRFPPMADPDSFGFVDPSDVLRGCHVIPAFSRGKLYSDGKGMSTCARDSGDWAEYYVNR